MIFAIMAFGCTVIASADEVKSDAPQKEMRVDDARQVHVRSLAASCAACHGHSSTGANHIVSLNGLSAADIAEKLQDFKDGKRIATVMHQHAKGLDSQEILDLAAYFSVQTPLKSITLPSQKLLANHAN